MIGGWFDVYGVGPVGFPDGHVFKLPSVYEWAPTTTAAGGTTTLCGHCGLYHQGPCTRIKAIEYYPNGTIKRVEYHPIWTGGGPSP